MWFSFVISDIESKEFKLNLTLKPNSATHMYKLFEGTKFVKLESFYEWAGQKP